MSRRVLRRPEGERGFALLVVLWSLIIISLFTAQILAAGRTAVSLANNVRAGAEARARADGAIHEGLFHVMADGTAHWAPDGATHVVVDGGVPVAVKIQRLDNKINPNKASTALLAGLFQACGAGNAQAGQLADAVIQWRSQSVSPAAAQKMTASYQQAGLPYGPAGHPFEDIGALAYVIGMPAGLLARVEPHMSLYQPGDPDPKDSDAVVRQALALAGQTGSGNPSYTGTQQVVSIVAETKGMGGGLVRRAAIIGIGMGGAPYQILSLTGGN